MGRRINRDTRIPLVDRSPRHREKASSHRKSVQSFSLFTRYAFCLNKTNHTRSWMDRGDEAASADGSSLWYCYLAMTRCVYSRIGIRDDTVPG